MTTCGPEKCISFEEHLVADSIEWVIATDAEICKWG